MPAFAKRARLRTCPTTTRSTVELLRNECARVSKIRGFPRLLTYCVVLGGERSAHPLRHDHHGRRHPTSGATWLTGDELGALSTPGPNTDRRPCTVTTPEGTGRASFAPGEKFCLHSFMHMDATAFAGKLR